MKSDLRALTACLAVIMVANASVLGWVAYNRVGPPDAVFELSERELSGARRGSMSGSDADVYLRWRMRELHSPDDAEWSEPSYGGTVAEWLSDERMRELGFDTSIDLDSQEGLRLYSQMPSRRAFFVLEFDGPTYQTELARLRDQARRLTAQTQADPRKDEILANRAQSARSFVAREEQAGSRLFLVDAGPDPKALRARYPDRHHYAIVTGRVTALLRGEPGQRRLMPVIYRTDGDALHRPHGTPRGYFTATATVKFGRQFRPWISRMAAAEMRVENAF